ncbi:MAG: hypothetical protein WBZ51_06875 [Xanthobacteraceae bacterium]
MVNAEANSMHAPWTSPILAKNGLYPHPPSERVGGTSMQAKRIYQVQHWPDGEWDRGHNWKKIEAASEKEAAEMVCGFPLTATGRLAQLRARVLKFGDLRQRSATDFYAVE